MSRIASLDQFRGYTVAGMFLVNFLGSYAATPAILKHHRTYCSYADTIMPQFLFAVGFAFRLAFLKHVERHGRAAAVRTAIQRSVALILIGAVIYHLDGTYKNWSEMQELGVWGVLSKAFRRTLFQALVHIGVTSLWILPVIAASARTQWAFLAASGLLHLGLSAWFWQDWLIANRVIDGGALGFLTWSIPALTGSIACQTLRDVGTESAMRVFARWSAGLMALGYAISCFSAGGVVAAPPFFAPWHPRDLWTMSQQSASISYLTFCAGFSLLVYVFFLWWSDLRGRSWALFATFGGNALAAYVLHDLAAEAVKPYTPRDAPAWYVAIAFAVFFGGTWAMVRSLEKNGVYIKL